MWNLHKEVQKEIALTLKKKKPQKQKPSLLCNLSEHLSTCELDHSLFHELLNKAD